MICNQAIIGKELAVNACPPPQPPVLNKDKTNSKRHINSINWKKKRKKRKRIVSHIFYAN